MAQKEIGPIARKIIAAGRKQQRQQVVDLSTVRQARDEMRRIIDKAVPTSEVGETFPGFTAYIYVTNWALGLVEAAQDVRELPIAGHGPDIPRRAGDARRVQARAPRA